MSRNILRTFIIVTLLISVHRVNYAQRGNVRVMFYNLENLFDTINNPETHDDEFLPDGDKNWDSYRYWKKIKRTFQVIAAAGEERPPEILGVCEVESFLPLYNLANNTPLSKYPYTIIHKDSPDKRGIDVALMYQKEKVQLLNKTFIQVEFPTVADKITRDILFASFMIGEDTVHVFVNHWPSRMGGQAKSEPYRVHVAEIVSHRIDSLLIENSNSKIIVMGDLNDEPENISLEILTNTSMINLSGSMKEKCNCGTYKYKTHWNMLDQVLVSPALMNIEKLYVLPESLKIFNPQFLLESDEANGGVKPYRTYLGPRYIGGYSDHLPVLLDLYYSNTAR